MLGLLYVIIWLWLMINCPALLVLVIISLKFIMKLKQTGIYGKHIIFFIIFAPSLLFILFGEGVIWLGSYLWNFRLYKGNNNK